MKDVHLKEQKRHGDPDFPVQYYYVDADHPRYEMTLHWHREFEIVRVQQGVLWLYLNNECHLLRAGDVAFVSSGVMHRAEPAAAVYECIVFDLNMLCRQSSGRITGYILPLLSGDVTMAELTRGSSPVLFAAVNRFFEVMIARGRYFELHAYAAAAELIYTLYSENHIRLPEKPVTTEQRRKTIITLIDWIEQNYTEHITLATLSEVAGTGEKYLCRFFKTYTGNTPIDYVNRLRVERACLKMAEERRNVTEAAFESGFNDMSYFSKIFKRYKGVTPREYRRRLTEGAKQ